MSCSKYQKIDTLFVRDDKFKIDETKIRRPEFNVPSQWLVTEKIDGTNIRISLEIEHQEVEPGIGADRWVMRINGRGDNSQIPPNLLRWLQEKFTLDGLRSLWRDDEYPITLYGEGYGGGIQKGGEAYTSQTKGGGVSFRLFDVLVGNTLLRRTDVEDVASKLHVNEVPLLGIFYSLADIVKVVKNGIKSVVATREGTAGHPAEGIVAFTAEPLYNNRGQRLMFKLKGKDFK